MRRRWGIVLVLVTLMGVGCSGGAKDDVDSSTAASAGDEAGGGSDATTAASALYAADGDTSAERSVDDDSSGAEGASLPEIGTKVVRTADLRVKVEKGEFGDRL